MTSSRIKSAVSYSTKHRRIQLRPRHNLPSYVPLNTTDSSYMDITDSKKDKDETYIPPPSMGNDTENTSDLSSILMQDSSNHTEDFLSTPHSDPNTNETYLVEQKTPTKTSIGVNTLLLDSILTSSPPLLQVACNITIGKSANVLANESDISIIENSGSPYMLEDKDQLYIPPSESEESYSTNDYTTSQLLSPELPIIPPIVLELSHCNNQNFIPSRESEGLCLTKNYRKTSQSLSPELTTAPSKQDTVPTTANYIDDPPSSPSTSNSLSEFDDSDRDETYNPAYETSSVGTTYSREIGDEFQAEPLSPSTLENPQDLTTSASEELKSLSPELTTAPSKQDTVPTTTNCIDDPPSTSNSFSEFDDSDRDETYNPAYETSSVGTTYSRKIGDEFQAEPLSPSTLENPQDLATSNSEELNNGNQGLKSKRIRTKDYCFFCEIDVLNFARHIMRNHAMESEVQRILSYPKKSSTRKNLITNLRKRGNYIKNSAKCDKPMKKSNIYPNIDYLPCEKCLGFYSKKQLWKHKRSCQLSNETSSAQSDSQNFLIRNLNIDKKLRDEVFPRMRPDKISLEAKRDPLICSFGAQYQRIHREKHFINVTSRKMRELAKLLIELKKLRPSLKNLTDCLKPQNYDLIVTATKNVANYDDKTDRYGAPTYAMNISTSLKQCCNIAIMAALKSDSSLKTAEIEADLKTLIQLIEANWKFDISSQACSDLNLKKWNKITIVPLANDLKLLKNHLSEKSKSAVSKLKSEKSDIEAYTTLTETTYCRILLLNRRRPGELQRMPISTYQECDNDSNAYEEFDRAISSAEKLLVKSFKRIVIRGKRGRGVPVLLTDEVQSDINLLLSMRRKYISDNNSYLFAKPGPESTLCGYKVLKKYAKSSGAKNPEAITSTKLRKHLATLTQMFNLKETDIEQLANFMGHTQAIHRQNYRLPDDVYQTAKLSKLLLLMESGNADQYKGKALDDIDLDLEQDLLQDTGNCNDNYDDMEVYDAVVPTEEAREMNITDDISVDAPKNVEHLNITTTTETRIKKKRNLVPWTPEQKKIVTKFFTRHIKMKQPPKRHECEHLRKEHPDVLHNKDWLKIKVFIQNIYKNNN